MLVHNLKCGDPTEKIDAECEQMFESLSMNAWDGVIDAALRWANRGEEVGPEVVQQEEREDDDVV
jgi:hypothetical protein